MRIVITLFALLAIVANCKPKKSPEERMKDLIPKVFDVTCSKMIECSKDEFAKIPENMKSMIPVFMQSKDKCVSYFDEQKKAKENLPNAKAEKVTEEEVNSAELCINGMEKAKCEDLKSTKGPGSIPGCESLQKVMK